MIYLRCSGKRLDNIFYFVLCSNPTKISIWKNIAGIWKPLLLLQPILSFLHKKPSFTVLWDLDQQRQVALCFRLPINRRALLSVQLLYWLFLQLLAYARQFPMGVSTRMESVLNKTMRSFVCDPHCVIQLRPQAYFSKKNLCSNSRL